MLILMLIYVSELCPCAVCTKNDIHIEIVSFDQYFYEKHLDKLTKFYNHFMLPEIVYPSVKFDLPALDISKL